MIKKLSAVLIFTVLSAFNLYSDEFTDELQQFIGKKVEVVYNCGDSEDVTGYLIEVNENFIKVREEKRRTRGESLFLIRTETICSVEVEEE